MRAAAPPVWAWAPTTARLRFTATFPTGSTARWRCHLAVFDESAGWFTLVLEDIADATVGDQIRGCFNQQAQLAIGALAQLHAPAFNDAAEGLRDYLNQPNPLNQAALSVLHADVCRAFVSVLDGWAADRRTHWD